MQIYKVRIFTGPIDPAWRAAFAQDDVIKTLVGTEHVYVWVEADSPTQALALASDACGYLSSRPDLGDRVEP
jgi:hypothetical protein